MLQTTAISPPTTITPDLFGFVQEETTPSSSPPPETIRRPAKTSATEPAIARSPPALRRRSDNNDEDESAQPMFNGLDEDDHDTPESIIAKRMFRLLLDDLAGKCDAPPDMFGQVIGNREQRKQDALIWMFSLNPDGAAMPFDWVCNEIGIDHEAVKRITARNMRGDLRRLLQMLSFMFGTAYGQKVEVDLLDYVNLDGWQCQ